MPSRRMKAAVAFIILALSLDEEEERERRRELRHRRRVRARPSPVNAIRMLSAKKAVDEDVRTKANNSRAAKRFGRTPLDVESLSTSGVTIKTEPLEETVADMSVELAAADCSVDLSLATFSPSPVEDSSIFIKVEKEELNDYFDENFVETEDCVDPLQEDTLSENTLPSVLENIKIEIKEEPELVIDESSLNTNKKQKQSRAEYMRDYRSKIKERKKMQGISKPPPVSSTERWRKFIAKKRNNLTQATSSGMSGDRAVEAGFSVTDSSLSTGEISESTSDSCSKNHQITGKHLQCLCGYSTERSVLLKALIQSKHNGENPFKCHRCNYETVYSGDLRRHIRSQHSEGTPSHCPFCMKIHIQRKYSGEKPVQCTFCNYKTVFDCAMKSHIQLKHAKSKPFQCTYCSYKTVASTHLRQHIQSKHLNGKPFVCSHCGYKSAQKVDLKKHIFIHMNEKQ